MPSFSDLFDFGGLWWLCWYLPAVGVIAWFTIREGKTVLDAFIDSKISKQSEKSIPKISVYRVSTFTFAPKGKQVTSTAIFVGITNQVWKLS